MASGPSTETVDLTLISGLRCIAVSHGYRAASDADVLIAGGVTFWKTFDPSLFRGPLMVITKDYRPWTWLEADDPRIVYMDRAGKFGLTDSATALCGSETSVMLAINYAVHRGAKRIILLGCDGQPSLDGRRRVHSGYPDDRRWKVRYAAHEEAMRTQIEPLAALGVCVVNCSPGSALTCYRRADLSDAVACL